MDDFKSITYGVVLFFKCTQTSENLVVDTFYELNSFKWVVVLCVVIALNL